MILKAFLSRAVKNKSMHLFWHNLGTVPKSCQKKREETMKPKDYVVDRIDGEYAYLKDAQSGNELFIALALLPTGTDTGSFLHYEMMEYTLM